VNLLWVTSHFSVSSEPLPTPDDKSAHRQTVVGSGERRCYPTPSPRKFTSSRFTSSAWVQVMQCGPSFTTNRRAPLISLAVRSPEALCGLTLKRDQRTDETAAENPKNDIAARRRHFRFTS